MTLTTTKKIVTPGGGKGPATEDGPALPPKGGADWSEYDTTLNTLYVSAAPSANDAASSWAEYDVVQNCLYAGTGAANAAADAAQSAASTNQPVGAPLTHGDSCDVPLSPTLAANAMRLKVQQIENEKYMLPSSSTAPVYDVDGNGPSTLYASPQDAPNHDGTFASTGFQVEKGVLRVKSARRSNPLLGADVTYAVPIQKSERRKTEHHPINAGPTIGHDYRAPTDGQGSNTLGESTYEWPEKREANYDGFGQTSQQNNGGASPYNVLNRRRADPTEQSVHSEKAKGPKAKAKKKKKKKKVKKKGVHKGPAVAEIDRHRAAVPGELRYARLGHPVEIEGQDISDEDDWA